MSPNSSPINQVSAGFPFAHRAPGQHAKNLVIVRAGNSSLHEHWMAGPEERNWDLVVSYFGNDPDLYRRDDVVRIDSKGAKWTSLYDFVCRWRPAIMQYDYIWLPDDDLAADTKTINRMFDLCADFKLELAQPALTLDSYYTHPITLQNDAFMLRYTNFVEIMAPVFSRAFFPLCADTFKENLSGFGLDLLWPTWLGGGNKAGILDACTVRHTRPLGGPNHAAVCATGMTPRMELAVMVKKYFLIDLGHKILGAVDRQGRRLCFAECDGIDLIQKLILGCLPAMAEEKFAIIGMMGPMLEQLAKSPTRVTEIPTHKTQQEARTRAALQLATELMQAGNPGYAIVILRTALLEVETSDLWNHWATAQCACGDFVRAEWGYRCALRLEPSHRGAAVNLAVLLLKQGRNEESSAFLRPHAPSLQEWEKQAIRQLAAPPQPPAPGIIGQAATA